MENKRLLERHNMFYYLEVMSDGKKIGNLLDINVLGMRLLSEKEIAIGSTLELTFNLPHEIDGVSKVELTGETINCAQKEFSTFYQTGIKITSIADNYKSLIEELILHFELKQ